MRHGELMHVCMCVGSNLGGDSGRTCAVGEGCTGERKEGMAEAGAKGVKI